MRIVYLSIGFVLLSLLFWAIESFWPSIPAQRKLRRGLGTDVFYWFFTPLVTRSISQLAILIALVPLLLLMGHKLEDEELRNAVRSGYGSVLFLPYWLQALLIILGGDFISYWTHRWFHGRWLWPYHAIHHSSKELDWLASVRQHPVNDLGTRLLQSVPFLLVGFSPTVVAVYLPFLTFYALLLHANVPWTFGPLRYVLASPAFHRWHHSKEDEALNKNFAGLLPILDVLFGTYYMPLDRQPSDFGVHDDSVPEGFFGQLLYPFQPQTPRIAPREEQVPLGVSAGQAGEPSGSLP